MLVLFLENIHLLVLLVEFQKKPGPPVRDRAISKLTSKELITLKPIERNMAISIHVTNMAITMDVIVIS